MGLLGIDGEKRNPYAGDQSDFNQQIIEGNV